jgi:hypothetical protein
MKKIILGLLLCYVQQLYAQTVFSFSGGIKQSRFDNELKRISAVNPNSNYRESDNVPVVHKTISFFAGVNAERKFGRFSFAGDLGFDMLQLNIRSGIRRFSPTSTLYTHMTNTEAQPRLKTGVSLNYFILNNTSGELSLGLKGMQFTGIGSESLSYPAVGADLRFRKNGISIFFSASASVNYVEFKNFDQYMGNLNADHVAGEFGYKIYDFNLGMSVPLR